VRSCELQKFWE